MPSPFPGMNPYLEQDDAWHSFHERFCTRLADELVAATGPRYLVKLDENVYVHELASGERRVVAASCPVTVAPAHQAFACLDIEPLSYVEVRDARSRRLITVVELLSPTNKSPGSDRDQYLAKRARLMAQGVNLVEIDLLRGGPRMPMEGVPMCDYLVMVARPADWPRAGIWPVRLREPLPTIPVPLAEPDPDVRVDLQRLLHAIYDAARYDRFVYAGEPDPPLRGDDAAWAVQFVPAGRN